MSICIASCLSGALHKIHYIYWYTNTSLPLSLTHTHTHTHQNLWPSAFSRSEPTLLNNLSKTIWHSEHYTNTHTHTQPPVDQLHSQNRWVCRADLIGGTDSECHIVLERLFKRVGAECEKGTLAIGFDVYRRNAQCMSVSRRRELPRRCINLT